MVTIYFVRHGEVHNPSDIFYGRMNRFRLSNTGIQQIEKTVQFLKNQSIDYIFSSPLLRARQTASIIQKEIALPTVHRSKLLLEVKTIFQGLPKTELLKTNFNFYTDPKRSPNDDTMQSILTRMLRFCENVYTKYPNKRIVAVTHGDPIEIISAYCNKKPLTLESIRSEDGSYLTYGEVRKISVESSTFSKSETVFRPNL